MSSRYHFADGVTTALSLATIVAVCFLVRDSFKKHHMNVFSHLIFLLTIFALVGKFQLPLVINTLLFYSTGSLFPYRSNLFQQLDLR